MVIICCGCYPVFVGLKSNLPLQTTFRKYRFGPTKRKMMNSMTEKSDNEEII